MSTAFTQKVSGQQCAKMSEPIWPFAAGDDGHVACRFAEHEIEFLGQLPGLARLAIDDDEVSGRLMPDAVPNDPGASAEFRELTEADLIRSKQRAINRFEATLPVPDSAEAIFILEPADANDWLTVIHDARFAIGVKLEVTEDSLSGDVSPDDPLFAYGYLCDLEAFLVRAIAGTLEGWGDVT